jgi:hypothetical protein
MKRMTKKKAKAEPKSKRSTNAELTQTLTNCKNCGKPTKNDFHYCDACYKAYTGGGNR